MKNFKVGCVLLAAGKGTRMKSETPKVLFDICGKPMIVHLLDTVIKVKEFEKIYIVIGYKADEVKNKILSLYDHKILNKVIFVKQDEQKGSGDALLKVKRYSEKMNCLAVISADVPLISEATIKMLVESHLKEKVECTVLTTTMDNPYGYGRIIRDISKKFIEIVEEVDANDSQKKIKEINTGIYVFSLPVLWKALSKIKPDNKKKEYYLTDAVKYLTTKNALLCSNSDELKGVNTKEDLTEIIDIVRKRIIKKLLLDGVNIHSPDTIYIDLNTKILQDTEIFQGSTICNSEIKSFCKIGPFSYIDTSRIENNTHILYSYIVNTQIGNNCKIGPFSKILDTKICNNVIIGNFAEVIRSVISDNVKIKHHSYIGDTEIENKVNIGAGVITCNYDGVRKNKTYIGQNTFVGSNVNLVAPIKIGKNVLIAAGSTITKDVPDNTLAIARTKEIFKQNHPIIKNLVGK
ncbi:MAG: bifunctional UDP-N-acetylglucosamine diphosphorylase/glucosamine-1-phosphate N-acetyltransferase GlmU [Endomicrobiia bacterium]